MRRADRAAHHTADGRRGLLARERSGGLRARGGGHRLLPQVERGDAGRDARHLVAWTGGAAERRDAVRRPDRRSGGGGRQGPVLAGAAAAAGSGTTRRAAAGLYGSGGPDARRPVTTAGTSAARAPHRPPGDQLPGLAPGSGAAALVRSLRRPQPSGTGGVRAAGRPAGGGSGLRPGPAAVPARAGAVGERRTGSGRRAGLRRPGPGPSRPVGPGVAAPGPGRRAALDGQAAGQGGGAADAPGTSPLRRPLGRAGHPRRGGRGRGHLLQRADERRPGRRPWTGDRLVDGCPGGHRPRAPGPGAGRLRRLGRAGQPGVRRLGLHRLHDRPGPGRPAAPVRGLARRQLLPPRRGLRLVGPADRAVGRAGRGRAAHPQRSGGP